MQLFLNKRLPDQITYFKTVRSTDNQAFDITVQLAREVEAKSCFQLYNIIFRKVLRLLKLKQIGRHYFNPALPAQIPQHNMELWPGYITAIAEYDAGVLLNIDVAHKVLRTDNVLDHIARLRQNIRNPKDLQEAAQDYLTGQVVLTRYNNRTYHIDGIAWDLTPKSSFKLANGETITYSEYYKKTYSREIRDLNQPLLVNKAKKMVRRGDKGSTVEETIYLVPELCCMTGLCAGTWIVADKLTLFARSTDEMRKNFSVMKDISQHTIIPPSTRKASLERFIKQIYDNEEISTELKGWKMEFGRQLLQLKGRVLGAEKIIFKNRTVPSQNAEWTRELRNIELVQGIPLQNWVIIYSARAAPAAKNFIANLARAGSAIGLKSGAPVDVPLQRDGAGDYTQAIRDRYVPGQTQLVVCILPDDRKDRYDAIKKYCVADTGIVSQCMLARTLNNEKIMLAALTKVALQMNVKLGGQLWSVEVPLKNCMVIGIDVYHDSLQKGTSVAGFCASMNSTFTKYYTRVVFQRGSQELMDGLARCMSDSLKKYFEVNGQLPERIIIFRDGVGDGQMGFVVQHEVAQIKQVFAGFGGEYNPKFSVVVVKKRINSRMMVAGDSSNPPPGTIVYNGITGKDTYDYFLVAQAVRQGTVTPTHYFVVHDTSGLQAMHLIALTFKLTHLYYNWPGTVRVPAPCQYAHKIAFLIGTSVHKEPHQQLTDKLFYL